MSKKLDTNATSVESDLEYRFPPETITELNALMVRIGQGDQAAANQFLKTIDGRVKRISQRIADRIFGDEVDEALIEDGLQEVLLNLLVVKKSSKYFSGKDDSWNLFSAAFIKTLESKYESLRNQINSEADNINRLAAAVSDAPAAATKDGWLRRLSGEQVDAARALLKPTTPTPEEALFAARRTEALKSAIERLPPREQEVLSARLDGDSFQTIALTLEKPVSPVTATGIQDRAIKKLGRHDKKGVLLSHLDREGTRHTAHPNDYKGR